MAILRTPAIALVTLGLAGCNGNLFLFEDVSISSATGAFNSAELVEAPRDVIAPSADVGRTFPVFYAGGTDRLLDGDKLRYGMGEARIISEDTLEVEFANRIITLSRRTGTNVFIDGEGGEFTLTTTNDGLRLGTYDDEFDIDEVFYWGYATPEENLPGGTVTYAGEDTSTMNISTNRFGDQQGLKGDVDLDVNFVTGRMTGTLFDNTTDTRRESTYRLNIRNASIDGAKFRGDMELTAIPPNAESRNELSILEIRRTGGGVIGQVVGHNGEHLVGSYGGFVRVRGQDGTGDGVMSGGFSASR